MIVDYRIYLSLYALVVVAWVGITPLIGNARDKTVSRAMFGVMGAAIVIGLINYLDWLWS